MNTYSRLSSAAVVIGALSVKLLTEFSTFTYNVHHVFQYVMDYKFMYIKNLCYCFFTSVKICKLCFHVLDLQSILTFAMLVG